MIVNYESLIIHISSWIKNYLKKNGKEYLVIDLSNNISSMTLAALCKHSNILTVHINTYTSENEYSSMDKFVNTFNIEQVRIPITMEDTFNYCLNCHSLFPKKNILHKLRDNKQKLQSNTKASILSFIAHSYNGVIAGGLDKTKYSLIRSYGKYGNGNVDILPLADLYNDEIFDLFDHLKADLNKGAPTFTYNKEKLLEAEIERNKGISNNDLEWVDAQNRQSDIINDEQDPVRHKAWLRYTKKQREVIAKIHQLEKLSRHKHNPNIPVCKIRDKSWVVK